MGRGKNKEKQGEGSVEAEVRSGHVQYAYSSNIQEFREGVHELVQ